MIRELSENLSEKHFGDFRRIINELQKYSQVVRLIGILSTISEINVSELVNYLKNKKFLK